MYNGDDKGSKKHPKKLNGPQRRNPYVKPYRKRMEVDDPRL